LLLLYIRCELEQFVDPIGLITNLAPLPPDDAHDG
jgi:hypothetical protein